MDFSLPAHRTRSHATIRPSWRGVLLTAALAGYLLLTLGIVFRSPVLTLDADLFGLNLRHNHSGWKPWVKVVELFGQRGPANLTFLPFFIWMAWRNRTTRPLVMLGTSLILLNLSVGVVKLVIGRLGPRETGNTHDVFVDGNIYPSGHVSNAVVLYGLIAILVVNHRKIIAGLAVLLSVAVGLGTVYLDTHWFSDVVGGWFAGVVVLLALPSIMPFAQRWTDSLIARARRRFGHSDVEARAVAQPGGVADVRGVRIDAPRTEKSRQNEKTRQTETTTPVSSEA